MTKKLKQKAFSLIELAIVLLIIGVIIAGIFAGNFLIKKARISTARTLTNSSAVHSIKIYHSGLNQA